MIAYDLILLSLATSMVAITYSSILTSDGHLLSGIAVWMQAHLPDWLYRPLIGCSLCVSGQMALWYYLIQQGSFQVELNTFYYAWPGTMRFLCFNVNLDHYSLIDHIVYISFSIFISSVIQPLHTWIKRKLNF